MMGERLPIDCSRSRLSYFLDINALKVMLVLYRDNPDVSFKALLETSGIEKDKFTSLLEELISVDLVNLKVSEETEENLFTLSEEARMGLNRLGAGELLK